jgi:DNA-directed RNA polymerase subunit H (RpoH/RPB5)
LAVKSSTKKRLVELGISEAHAHSLADDANLDAIKRMTVDQVAKKVSLETGDSALENIMNVISEHVGSRKRSKSNRITISRKALLDEDIPRGEFRFNVLNHILVPHHELVPIDHEADVLEPWDLLQKDVYGNDRLAKELLPKILITDPAIQAIKEMEESENDELPAGWLANRVVKVIRYSRSAGSSVAFRLIVERT